MRVSNARARPRNRVPWAEDPQLGPLDGTACLILDVRMPGMSGIELQERLIDSGCPVPIIFVTAHADEEARARSLERAAVASLQKPFSDDALLDVIAKAIGTPSRP